MNRVVVVGRLTRDPDLRYTPNGVAVANFNVAVNRPFRNQQGEQEADFINCVTWRKQAENLANYMKKGSQIGVDGRVQTRTYENKDGQTVYVTEIQAESVQFLEPRGMTQQRPGDSGGGSNQNQGYQQQNRPPQPQANPGQGSAEKQSPFEGAGERINISDDDLPF